MAKESMKAREVKRLKLVEKYAAKRAALKAAGDFAGLAAKKFSTESRYCIIAFGGYSVCALRMAIL